MGIFVRSTSQSIRVSDLQLFPPPRTPAWVKFFCCIEPGAHSTFVLILVNNFFVHRYPLYQYLVYRLDV